MLNFVTQEPFPSLPKFVCRLAIVDISLSDKRCKTLLRLIITLAHTNYIFLSIGNTTHVSNTDHINLNVVVALAKNILFLC